MKIPIRRRHKPSGQDRCRYNGKDYYFGKHGSPESDRRYNNWLKEILSGNTEPPPPKKTAVNVNGLVERFMDAAKSKYSDGEYGNLKQASRVLLHVHRNTSINGFGPKAIIEVRDEMVALGWPRGRVNEQIRRVRRIFRWGVSQELVHVHTSLALREILPLRNGESPAPESKPVCAATPYQVHAILPELTPTVAAMVQVQLLTGMRPSDLFSMCRGDIDTSDDVWVYRPKAHKNKWRGKGLAYAIGPKAQDLLKSRMSCGVDEHLFTPQQSIRERGRTPGDNIARCYNRHSYRNAIVRATARLARGCERVMKDLYFTPNQLRHSKATAVRSEHGIEAARVALGHSSITTTLIYAEADLEKAKAIALASG